MPGNGTQSMFSVSSVMGEGRVDAVLLLTIKYFWKQYA